MCAHGPIHLASDSEAFIKKAHYIIKCIHKNKKFKRAWGTTSDGDLWEHFYKAVKKKSPEAVKFTWVKGHATDEHIQKGITTKENREGNKIADETADIGVSLFGKDTLDMANILHKRHDEFQKFMIDVSKHIVEAHVIHRVLMDKYEKQEKDKRDQQLKVPYRPLQYPTDDQTRFIRNVLDLTNFDDYKKRINRADQIEIFLSNLKITEAGSDMRHITWIELYILYRIRGFSKPKEDPKNQSHHKIAPDKQILAFKKLVQEVIAKVCNDDGDGKLFAAAKMRADALKGVGLLGNQAGPKINVAISEEEKKLIAAALTQPPRSINGVKLDEFLEGERLLSTNPLSLRGKVGWDTSLESPNRVKPKLRWKTQTDADMITELQTTEFYTCPKCNNVEPSDCVKFSFKNLDQKQKCNTCRRQVTVKDWNCRCGVRWYLCPEHGRNQPPQLKRKRPTTATSQDHPNPNRPKRLRSIDDLYEEDLRRRTGVRVDKRQRLDDREQEDVSLGEPVVSHPRTSLLSPALRQRYLGWAGVL